MHTNEQKQFAEADHETAEQSLKKICKLFAELDSELEKWHAHSAYNIANDASGGWITRDKAIKQIRDHYARLGREE